MSAALSHETPPAPAEARVPRYAWYVLGLLLVVNIVNYVDRQILAILLPDIRDEFGASDTALAALQPAFFWAHVVAGLVIARLAERGVRRSILAAGLAFWSLTTALAGFAQSIFQLTLARIGVGAGEASTGPTIHPLIADYFPASRRATAYALTAIGVHLGILVGFIIGGVVAQELGWRRALFIVGAPGLLLAVVVRATLTEPERGAADGVRASRDTPPFVDVVRFAWRTRSLRWLALGAAIATLGGAALFHFGPSHVARVTGLSRGEIGAGMGLAAVAGGLIGTSLAGVLTDWLAKRDSRAYFATSALASLGAIPFILAFLFADEPRLGFVWLAISVFFTSMYLGPVAALPQTLSPLRMRATLVVVLGLVNTGIGQGLGALLVGTVSDAMRPVHGEASLQRALAWVVSGAYAASLIFYVLGARHVRADLADAAARSSR